MLQLVFLFLFGLVPVYSVRMAAVKQTFSSAWLAEKSQSRITLICITCVKKLFRANDRRFKPSSMKFKLRWNVLTSLNCTFSKLPAQMTNVWSLFTTD